MPRKIPHCSIHADTPLSCVKCLYIERGRKGGAIKSEAQIASRRALMHAINARKKEKAAASPCNEATADSIRR